MKSTRHMVDNSFTTLENDTTKHVEGLLTGVSSVTLSFDLWMSRKTDDILAVVAHFLDAKWIWRHVVLGLLNCDQGTSVE
jgi:hypothetical protein